MMKTRLLKLSVFGVFLLVAVQCKRKEVPNVRTAGNQPNSADSQELPGSSAADDFDQFDTSPFTVPSAPADPESPEEPQVSVEQSDIKYAEGLQAVSLTTTSDSGYGYIELYACKDEENGECYPTKTEPKPYSPGVVRFTSVLPGKLEVGMRTCNEGEDGTSACGSWQVNKVEVKDLNVEQANKQREYYLKQAGVFSQCMEMAADLKKNFDDVEKPRLAKASLDALPKDFIDLHNLIHTRHSYCANLSDEVAASFGEYLVQKEDEQAGGLNKTGKIGIVFAAFGVAAFTTYGVVKYMQRTDDNGVSNGEKWNDRMQSIKEKVNNLRAQNPPESVEDVVEEFEEDKAQVMDDGAAKEIENTTAVIKEEAGTADARVEQTEALKANQSVDAMVEGISASSNELKRLQQIESELKSAGANGGFEKYRETLETQVKALNEGELKPIVEAEQKLKAAEAELNKIQADDWVPEKGTGFLSGISSFFSSKEDLQQAAISQQEKSVAEAKRILSIAQDKASLSSADAYLDHKRNQFSDLEKRKWGGLSAEEKSRFSSETAWQQFHQRQLDLARVALQDLEVSVDSSKAKPQQPVEGLEERKLLNEKLKYVNNEILAIGVSGVEGKVEGRISDVLSRQQVALDNNLDALAVRLKQMEIEVAKLKGTDAEGGLKFTQLEADVARVKGFDGNNNLKLESRVDSDELKARVAQSSTVSSTLGDNLERNLSGIVADTAQDFTKLDVSSPKARVRIGLTSENIPEATTGAAASAESENTASGQSEAVSFSLDDSTLGILKSWMEKIQPLLDEMSIIQAEIAAE